MKDKLIAAVTLGFIFSLFFYYKVVNPSEDNIISTITSTDSVEEFVQEVIEKENNMLENISPISDSMETEEKEECNLNDEQTDNLEFAEAFKYYRNCNGANTLFDWNNKTYSTILKSEIKDEVLLTEDEEVEEDSPSAVDKKHLQLQSQLIGDNLK